MGLIQYQSFVDVPLAPLSTRDRTHTRDESAGRVCAQPMFNIAPLAMAFTGVFSLTTTITAVSGNARGVVPQNVDTVQYQAAAGPGVVPRFLTVLSPEVPDTPVLRVLQPIPAAMTAPVELIVPTVVVGDCSAVQVLDGFDVQYQASAAALQTAATTPSVLNQTADLVLLQRNPLVPVSAKVFDLPTAVAELAWQPEYADFVSRNVLRIGPDGVGVDTPMLPVAALSWQGVYADRAPGNRPLSDWQTLALNPQPIAQTTDTFGWRGSYADQILTSKRSTFESTVTAILDRLTIPSAWDGVYPDFARAATRAPEYPFGPSILDRLTIPSSWDAVYPDFAARGALRITEGWRTDSLIQTTTPTSWQPEFADFITRQNLRLESQLVVPNVSQVTPANWEAKYPDTVTLLQQLRDTNTTFVDTPMLPVTALSWNAKYADFAKAKQPLTDWQTFAFYPSPILVPTNQLGWRPIRPDWLPTQRPVEFPAFTSGATASILPVRFTWRSVYVDRIDRLVLRTESATAVVLDRLTVPNDWRTSYPDRLSVATRPEGATVLPVTFSTTPTFFAAYTEQIVRALRAPEGFYATSQWQSFAPTGWEPTLPTQFVPPHTPEGWYTLGVAQTAIPVINAWQARLVDPVRKIFTVEGANVIPQSQVTVPFTSVQQTDQFTVPRRPEGGLFQVLISLAPLGSWKATYQDWLPPLPLIGVRPTFALP